MALGLPEDPKQQKLLLIGLVPLLALFAYWYFLHGDYVAEYQDMQSRVERLEISNTQARLRAPQSRRLEERLVKFERHIERLEELVPRTEEVSALLNTISERADQIGVTVARFTPGETQPGPHYDRRTFQLTVHGSYHEVARFLTAIGSLSRIITPIELNIVPLGALEELEEDGELEASFLIETYVLPGSKPPAIQESGAGA